jgi:hypothetical protein
VADVPSVAVNEPVDNKPDPTLVQQLDDIVILASRLLIDQFFDEREACGLILAGAAALEVHNGQAFLEHFIEPEAAAKMRSQFDDIKSLNEGLEMEDVKLVLRKLRGKIIFAKPPRKRSRPKAGTVKASKTNG